MGTEIDYPSLHPYKRWDEMGRSVTNNIVGLSLASACLRLLGILPCLLPAAGYGTVPVVQFLRGLWLVAQFPLHQVVPLLSAVS